ncbi:hypothetical protein ACIRSU_18835 [Streptomyces sp. NPDC101160]|uniref:hypothetical protein n=1 Tax=Streptomyces sp. NPDC101160 TaxID=3366118 RepID=UPI00381DE67C
MNTTQRGLAAALLAAAALGLAAAPHALAADEAPGAGLVGLLGLDHGPESGDQQATVSGNDSQQSIG